MERHEQDIRMELLEELMEEMDKNAVKPKGEPVAQVTEVHSKEVPLDQLKDVIKEKMSGNKADEETMGEESAAAMEHEDEEDDPDVSDFVKKLRAIQASKKATGK